MSNFDSVMTFWALSGAGIAQVIIYYFARQKNLNFDVVRALIVTLISLLGTWLYFTFVDSNSNSETIVFHYSLFLAMTIDIILNIDNFHIQLPPQQVQENKSTFHSNPTSTGGALILTGFSSVFFVGAFGALITEFTLIYYAHHTRFKKEKKLLQDRTKQDWGFSVAIIVLSGISVVVHGITDVSALTAMQLGAAGPLIKAKSPKGA